MNREEYLAFLVENLPRWPDDSHSAPHGWEFIDGQYVHTIHDPITIDDWNRAKIKPDTKIRILSKEHKEYVQKLAFESGHKWGTPLSESEYLNVNFIFFWEDGFLAYSYDESYFEGHNDKEIFIEMPKTQEQIYYEQTSGGLKAADVKMEDVRINNEKIFLSDDANAKVLAEKVGSKHSHYFKDVSDLDEVDVYRVCDLFEVNDPSGAKQHAIKKLLCSGQRGAKDERKDLEEARDTINRKLEMMKEDNQ